MLADELYLRIKNEENTFAEIATNYSEGVEKQTVAFLFSIVSSNFSGVPRSNTTAAAPNLIVSGIYAQRP